MADIPLSNLVGGTGATTSIKNAFSVTGYTRGQVDVDNAAVQTLSGALTAGVLKTILDEPYACRMSYLSVRVVDSAVVTIRVQVTVDGVIVYNSASADMAGINTGVCLAGMLRTGGLNNKIPDIVSTSSLKIEVASSVSATDKLLIQWLYNRTA